MRMLTFLKTHFTRSMPGNAIIIAAAGALVLLPVLASGFLIDDHYARAIFQGLPGIDGVDIDILDTFTFGEGVPERIHARMQEGLVPWWTPPDWHAAFWRPLSSLSHWIDYRLFGDAAVFMHLESLLLYLVTSLAVYTMYRRTIAFGWVAALAALLYVIDDGHSVPVTWISNRNTVLATLFAVLVMIFHDRWRRDGWRWGWPLAITSLLLGVLSGEAAVAVGGYLFAHALFLDSGTYPRRFARLLPYLAVIIGWRIVYSALGYGIAKAAIYTDPGTQPLRFAADVATFFPLLMLAQFGQPDPAPLWSFLPGLAMAAFWLAAAAVCALLAKVFWPLLRSDRNARFWAVGMVVATLPACATLPQARLLMLPGIGGMALVAMMLHRWYDGRDRSRLQSAFAYAFILLHLILAPLMTLGIAAGLPALERQFRQADLSLDAINSLESKHLIVINTMSDLHAVSIPVMRSSLRLPVPAHTRVLYAGLGDVHIERPDARTLILTPEDGFLPRPWGQVFVKPREASYHPGYSVELDGMRAEVLTILPDSRPETVKFTFDQSLEDPSLAIVQWYKGQYVSAPLPKPGRETTVPGISLREQILAQWRP